MSAAIGNLQSGMKSAIDTIKLYGMHASDVAKSAHTNFSDSFKKIGDGIHTAKERIQGALDIIGKAFLAVGATIALISWQGSKYAEDLWRAWVDASGKIEASSKGLDNFGSAVTNMAVKSKFSLGQVGEALKVAKEYGLDETKILGALSGAMEYSAAIGDDLSVSMEGIGKALKVFKDSSLTGAQAADILAKAHMSAEVSAEDMNLSLRALGPIANKLKWDFKDVIAMLEVFRSNNIEGGRAMMGLASILQDVIDPTSVLGKEIARTGLNVKDSSGKVKDIITLFKDLKSAGVDTSLIFGHLNAIIGPGLSNILEKGTGDLTKFRNELNNVDGFAKKISTEFEKTLPGAFQFFVARLKDLPVVLSFFLKDSLTALFTPMQKALGDLTSMIDKSGFAKKLDMALSPVFKSIGEWISKMIIKWADFIGKLKPEDIEKKVTSIKEFFKSLWEIIEKSFSGIDFAALISGLMKALVLLVAFTIKALDMFSKMPDWIKNIVILGAAFTILGGTQIIGGIIGLAGAFIQLGNALKTAGILALLSKFGVAGLVAAVGVFAAGKVVQGFKESSAAENSGEYKSYQTAGGKLGPGMWKDMISQGQTSAFGIPLQSGSAGKGKTTPEVNGLQKIKDELTESMKIEQDFSSAMDKEFEKYGTDTEELNKEIEKTRGDIKDETKNFTSSFGKTADKIVDLNNQTIEMMIQSQHQIEYLKARLEALEGRIASLNLSNKNRKKGI